MPDADKVNTSLSRRYQKVYKQVCEGYFSSDALAYEVLKPLRKDIQGFGNAPLQFLQEVAAQLHELRALPLLKPIINWSEESERISELKGAYSQKLIPNRRGMNFALIACKEILRKIKANEPTNPKLLTDIAHKYIQRIYESNFEDPILLTEDHYLEVSTNELSSRLNTMKPFIDDGIEHFATQIERNGRAKPLRFPPRANKRQTVDLLNDNVFNLE